MSDIKHQSDEELVRRLKSNAAYQAKLRAEIEALEETISAKKVRLSGNETQSRWMAHYLAGGGFVDK